MSTNANLPTKTREVEEMPQASRYATCRSPMNAELTANFYTYPIGYYFKRDYYFLATKLLILTKTNDKIRGRVADALQALYTEAELMMDESKEFSFDISAYDPNHSYRTVIKSQNAAIFIGAFLKADKAMFFINCALHDPLRRDRSITAEYAERFSWPFVVQFNAFKLLIMRDGRQAIDDEVFL